MNDLPQTLKDAIPKDLLAEAADWWRKLAEQDRAELERLCDARKEVFLFETFSESEHRPKISGGKFIPHDDAFGLSEWGEDYFDYLLGHPELMIVFDPAQRTFHIGCHRHVSARRCFQEGEITAGFRCPFESDACLMHGIRKSAVTVGLRRIGSR